MAEYPRVVAVGLLTEHELTLLGPSFDRAFPIEDSGGFEDLLQAIDEATKKKPARPSADKGNPA